MHPTVDCGMGTNGKGESVVEVVKYRLEKEVFAPVHLFLHPNDK